MKQFLILLCVFCSVIARNPRPWELLGGMNPDFEDFIPPTPIVSEGNSGESAVDNYPLICSFSVLHLYCGVYESECFDRILACK